MKLSEWARTQGVTKLTAYRWFRAGKMPCPAEKMASGTIIVHPIAAREGKHIIYARVSSADQKSDLDRQVARLCEYAAKHGMEVTDVVREIGSGLNGHRKGLLRSLAKTRENLIVEHRDRLTRFGFDYIEAALAQAGRKVIVVDDGELADDVVRDLHEVIVSMCARLYGKRAAANRAKRAMAAMEESQGDE